MFFLHYCKLNYELNYDISAIMVFNGFSKVLVEYGYFTFNYRDYPSLIRGGHNFNVLSVSDKRVGSIESKIDIKVLSMEQQGEPGKYKPFDI